MFAPLSNNCLIDAAHLIRQDLRHFPTTRPQTQYYFLGITSHDSPATWSTYTEYAYSVMHDDVPEQYRAGSESCFQTIGVSRFGTVSSQSAIYDSIDDQVGIQSFRSYHDCHPDQFQDFVLVGDWWFMSIPCLL